jgi:hypothetical protein
MSGQSDHPLRQALVSPHWILLFALSTLSLLLPITLLTHHSLFSLYFSNPNSTSPDDQSAPLSLVITDDDSFEIYTRVVLQNSWFFIAAVLVSKRPWNRFQYGFEQIYINPRAYLRRVRQARQRRLARNHSISTYIYHLEFGMLFLFSAAITQVEVFKEWGLKAQTWGCLGVVSGLGWSQLILHGLRRRVFGKDILSFHLAITLISAIPIAHLLASFLLEYHEVI